MLLLNAAEENGGWLTFSDLKKKKADFNNKERFRQAIDTLLMEGLGWEDEQPLFDKGSTVGVYANSPDDNNMVYWFPNLMRNQDEGKDDHHDIKDL